jgi:hypothetical protein
MASMVTMAPEISRVLMSSGIAVISFDLQGHRTTFLTINLRAATLT